MERTEGEQHEGGVCTREGVVGNLSNPEALVADVLTAALQKQHVKLSGAVGRRSDAETAADVCDLDITLMLAVARAHPRSAGLDGCCIWSGGGLATRGLLLIPHRGCACFRGAAAAELGRAATRGLPGQCCVESLPIACRWTNAPFIVDEQR